MKIFIAPDVESLESAANSGPGIVLDGWVEMMCLKAESRKGVFFLYLEPVFFRFFFFAFFVRVSHA
jgi:hypothetical protein